jgi:phosphatidylserine/phosphatidylglycerophosphate/cardiolipin synthase-like enzyme
VSLATTDALLSLPTHLRRRLAAALDSGFLDTTSSATALRTTLGVQGGDEESLLAVLLAWRNLGVTGPAAAAWLRSLDRLAGRFSSPDFVWSGPEVPGLHARDTRRVYEEVIAAASRSIWASTYAFFDGPRAFKALAERMDAQTGLNVTLMLNIERRRGDTTAPDHLVRGFADRFWERDWPGSARPSVFYDPRSLNLDGPKGVLHAKAIVGDEEAVFITSANFTEAALDRNIEMGMLTRDPHLALTVIRHFQVLIDRELLLPLPSD